MSGDPNRQEVAPGRRLNFLPDIAGGNILAGLEFEGFVYDAARRMVGSYYGGEWTFYRTSNAGAYMAPASLGRAKFALASPNGSRVNVSPDAIGVICSLLAYSNLAFAEHDLGNDETMEAFADGFHKLREYAADHAEAPAIFAAID